MDNKELYMSYVNFIGDYEIRHEVKKAVETVPDYFYTLLASQTGKNHGGESLVRHVVDCADILLYHAIPALRKHWTPYVQDIALAAILLHDCWRCGIQGSEQRDEKGRLKCVHTHPFDAFVMLQRVWGSRFLPSWKSEVLRAVRWHYGPWSTWETEQELLAFTSLPYTDIAMQVFLIDSSNTWNMEILRDRNKDDYPALFFKK